MRNATPDAFADIGSRVFTYAKCNLITFWP